MAEPDFIQRTSKAMDVDQRLEWFKQQADDADKQGARWHRFSWDESTQSLLYEGWKVRPEHEPHISKST